MKYPILYPFLNNIPPPSPCFFFKILLRVKIIILTLVYLEIIFFRRSRVKNK